MLLVFRIVGFSLCWRLVVRVRVCMQSTVCGVLS
jgi:hypothetical protein